jgi:hypothetical protein
MEPFDYFDELSSCRHLFLEELLEPEINTLRIRVIEGRASNIAVPIEVAGQSLGEGFPVKVDADSVRYEITWNSYVLYQVINESFGLQEVSQDGVIGSSASVYNSSTLLDCVFRSSNASHEYPGKLRHFSIACSDHVIDVVSTDRPTCRRIGPKPQVN